MARERVALNVGIGATVDKSLNDAFRCAEKKANAMQKNYRAIDRQLSKVKNIRRYEKQIEKLNDAVSDGTVDSKKFQKEHDRLTKQLDKAKDAAKLAGVNMNNLSDYEKELTDQADKARRAVAALNHELQRQARINLENYESGAGSQSSGGLDKSSWIGSGRTGRISIGSTLNTGANISQIGEGIGEIVSSAVALYGGLNIGIVEIAKRLTELKRISDREGIKSLRDVQSLSYAAGTSGVEYTELLTAISYLNDTISLAKNGGIEASQLSAIGLDIGRLSDLSPVKAIYEVSEAISKLPSREDREKLSKELFGGSSTEFLSFVELGTDKIKDLTNRFNNADISATEEEAWKSGEFLKEHQLLMAEFGRIRDLIGINLMPDLLKSLNSLLNWLKSEGGQEDVESALRLFLKLVENLPEIYEGIQDFLLTAKDIVYGLKPVVDGVSKLLQASGIIDIQYKGDRAELTDSAIRKIEAYSNIPDDLEKYALKVPRVSSVYQNPINTDSRNITINVNSSKASPEDVGNDIMKRLKSDNMCTLPSSEHIVDDYGLIFQD